MAVTEPVLSVLFFVVASLAGAINAVAGGGSFLLFPTLMFGGMSAVAANVMCCIAMWPGSIASCYAYWREVNTPIRTLRKLIFCGLLGGGIGACVLLYFPEETFAALVPWLLLVATLIFAFGRRVIARLRFSHATSSPLLTYLGMMIISIYGGYFGAGVGILLLATLQLAGYQNMHEMNGLKTVLSTAINAAAVAIFLGSQHVVWSHALVLVAGGITGGYVGTKLALRVHPEKVRMLVIVIAVAMTAYFFLKPT